MSRIAVKVTPNAKKSEVIGWVDAGDGGEALRLKLKAPPIDGKANKELVVFLAKTFGVPKSAVSILHGEKSRLKSVEIEGLNEPEIRERLV
jgi:uncharacterized protein (TIGR00251 family)